MEEGEVRGRQDEKEVSRSRRGVFTDRWMDNVLMTQDSPGDIAVWLCHSPLSSLSPPPSSPAITLFLSSSHSVSCASHIILYLMMYCTPTPFFSFSLLFIQTSNSPSPLPSLALSPLPTLLFSLMDGANVHQQQRPSGGDSFLQLLTEGHSRLPQIIHSFIPSIREVFMDASIFLLLPFLTKLFPTTTPLLVVWELHSYFLPCIHSFIFQ